MENTQLNSQAPRSGLAIAGLVLGIIAIATSFLPIINNVSFFIALIGLVFAIIGILGVRKGKNSGMGIAVAGLVLCIVAGAVVLGSQAMYSAAIDDANQQLDKMTGDATNDIVGVDVDVNVGNYSISKGQYGLIDSSLPVTVTNLTDKQQSFWVSIEAVDSTGARIDDYTVYFNNLNAGQSMTQEAFGYISDDDYAAMQGASFNIISVSEM